MAIFAAVTVVSSFKIILLPVFGIMYLACPGIGSTIFNHRHQRGPQPLPTSSGKQKRQVYIKCYELMKDTFTGITKTNYWTVKEMQSLSFNKRAVAVVH